MRRYQLGGAVTMIIINSVVAGVFVALPISAQGHFPGMMPVAGFCLAFGVVGGLRVDLEFSQQRAGFTLTEAVLVIALVHLGSPWIGLAVGAGEVLRCQLSGKTLLKTAFNAVSQMAAATVAAGAFHLLASSSDSGMRTSLAALIAVACWSGLNALSVSAVIAWAERQGFARTLTRSLPTAVATTLFGSTLGLLIQHLWVDGAAYALLVGPVAAGMWLNGRHAAGFKSEQLRFERLYEATTRTAEMSAAQGITAVVVREARNLMTGQAAACLLSDGNGSWQGQVLAPSGSVALSSQQVKELLADAVPPGEAVTTTALPAVLQNLVPTADLAVIARSPAGSECDLLVVVIRRAATKKAADRHLSDTLSAYVAHGAAIAANAALVEKLHQSLEAQMLANQRKDEFVSTISHELRTPLTVVVGAVETLLRLDDRVKSTDRVRLLHTAADQSHRLRFLIEDLLMVATAEQGQLTCELAVVATETLADDIWSDLPEQLRSLVHLERPPLDLLAVADRFKLRQIVTNLTQNAAKYAPGSPIEVSFDATTERIYMSVVDHGPGIPTGERDRVFERFVQLDQSATRAVGGTGLGLYICRQLAERMGATLELSETAGGGSTFTVGLTRSGSAAPPAAPPVPTRPEFLARPRHLVTTS